MSNSDCDCGLTAEIPRHILREKLSKAQAYYSLEADADRQQRENEIFAHREQYISEYMGPKTLRPRILWFPAKVLTRTREEAEALYWKHDSVYDRVLSGFTSHNEFKLKRIVEIGSFVDNEDLVHIRLSEKDLRMLDL